MTSIGCAFIFFLCFWFYCEPCQVVIVVVASVFFLVSCDLDSGVVLIRILLLSIFSVAKSELIFPLVRSALGLWWNLRGYKINVIVFFNISSVLSAFGSRVEPVRL